MEFHQYLRRVIAGDGPLPLVALLVLSLLIKALIICGTDVVNPDAVRYANSAHQILDGDLSAAFQHEKMLLFSLTLAAARLLVGDWILAGQLISAVFLTLTLIPLYLLTKDLFGSRAAIWASAAFILLPSLNELTSKVVKDAPFLFFITLALWLGQRALVNQRLGFFFASCGCAFAAAMFRLEGLLFLCIYFIWLIYQVLFRPVARPAAIRGLLVYVFIPVSALIIMSGLLMAGFREIGFLETVWQRLSQPYFQFDVTSVHNAIYGHLKTVEESFPGGQWGHDFFEIARYNILIIYLIGLLQALIAAIFPVFVVPLFLGVRDAGRCECNPGVLIWTLAAYLGMVYFFIVTRNFLSGRYLLVVVVMLLPFVGHGFERLKAKLSAFRFQKISIAVIVVLFIGLPIYKSFADTRNEKAEIRLAGEWLKQNQDILRQRIVTTDERIPFYAGLMRNDYDMFPDGMRQDFEQYAQANGNSLIVLGMSLRNGEKPPSLGDYILAKEFYGDKKVILVYSKKI